jgi:LysR family glycine cleavage system transcriptional activator
MAQFPWMTININSALWDPELTAKAAEVEIRFGHELEKTINCQRLCRDTCFPVCSPALAACDWRDYPLFDCLGMKANWQSWARGAGQAMPRGKRVNTASTYAVSLSTAQNGGAFALGHETLTDTLIAQGSLVRASEVAIDMPEAYYLIPVAAHMQPPSTRAFVKWLIGQIGDH